MTQPKILTRAIAGLIFLFVVVAVAFFGPAGIGSAGIGSTGPGSAGSLHDARAWSMLAVFFGCAGAITAWLWFHDKALLERRVKAGPGSEPDPVQNIVQALAGLAFVATFVVSGIDRRLGGSHVPLAVTLAGNAMIAIGFLIVFLTFRANTYTAGTVEIAAGQHVIDGGPYAFVRHPMYAGALVMSAGIPLALGSWWGLVPTSLLVPALVWRLVREEAFLAANLDGYDDYRSRVRYRLVPYVW